MSSETAYEAICRALNTDPRTHIVEAIFDEKNFGNFVISFKDDEEPRSVINDRGDLILCNDLEGTQDCRLILSHFYEADEEAVVAALRG